MDIDSALRGASELRVMLSLVRAGRPLGAEQISKRSGLKRPTVYAVMKRLEKEKAVSISHLDRGTAWRPVPDHSLAVAATGMAEALEKKARKLLASANELLKVGKHQEALETLDMVLSFEGENKVVWFERARTLFEMKKYDAALESCDRAIALESEDHLAWNWRGYILHELGRHGEALDACDMFLRLQPDDPVGWSNRGWVLSKLGRHGESLEANDRANALRPDVASTWRNRVVALLDLGRNDEALDAGEKAVALDPKDAHAWHNRGYALFRSGRFEEALASYDKAIQLRSDLYKTWQRRGDVLRKLGKEAEALESYDRALKLKPDDEETFKAREDLLVAMGRRSPKAPIRTRAKGRSGKRDLRSATVESGEGMSALPLSFKGTYIENAFFGGRENAPKASKVLKDLLTILDLPVAKAAAADRFKGMSHDELLTELVNWLRMQLKKAGYTCRAVPGHGIGDEGVDARLRVISDEEDLKIGVQVKCEGDAEKLSGKTQTQLLSALSQAGVDCMVLALCLPINPSTQASISHLVGPVDSALDGRVIILHPQTSAVLFERASSERGSSDGDRARVSASSIKGVLNISSIPLEEIEGALGERT